MSTRKKTRAQKTSPAPQARRGWPISTAYALVLTGAILVFAVWINSAIGRTIHWDLVTIFGSLAFLGMTVGRRWRII